MAENRVYTLNGVVSSLGELRGHAILIARVLLLEFESDSIWHRPKGECLP